MKFPEGVIIHFSDLEEAAIDFNLLESTAIDLILLEGAAIISNSFKPALIAFQTIQTVFKPPNNSVSQSIAINSSANKLTDT